MSFILIRGGRIFDPADAGCGDILICGGRIVASGGRIEPPVGLDTEVVEAQGSFVTPGFVDIHVHVTGGGGEGGPETRIPQLPLESITGAGVTTVVGLLGTDDVTRHPSSLLARTLALGRQGMTALMMTGSYQFPPVTVTGSVRGDLALIPPIIGTGEVALSDHRSSQPSFRDFAGLVAETRVGGLLGGKRGLVQVHMGAGKRGMEYIFRMLEETELPPSQVLPTHCARSQDLLAQAMSLVSMGGNVDVTAESAISGGRSGAALAMENFLEKGLPLERLTVSSDAGGSIPSFDRDGNLTGIRVALPGRMQMEFRRLMTEEDHDPQLVLPLFTCNPARRIGLAESKGRLSPGMDADLLLFDSRWNLTRVYSMGRLMVSNGVPVIREAVSFD